ncbi:zinc finger, CCHC-type containing protein [Tanacetum coccineum]
MTEIFRLLNELTASRALKKVLIREEARHPITKNVNSISLVPAEEEDNAVNNGAIAESIMEHSKPKEEEPLKKVFMTNEVRRRKDGKPARSVKEIVTRNEEEDPVGVSSSHTVGYYLKHIINEKLIEGLVKNQKFNDSWPNVLVDVAGYVYPMDFVVLDIKEDERRPFILGTPFLTTAKAVIKFDKGTITLKSKKSKISFQRIPEPQNMIQKGIKNDIEPIAPIMTVSRLVLEWEEKIKLHQEKEMKFNQWRSKIFKLPALVIMKSESEDEGEVNKSVILHRKQLMRLRAGNFLEKRIGNSLRLWRRRLGIFFVFDLEVIFDKKNLGNS